MPNSNVLKAVMQELYEKSGVRKKFTVERFCNVTKFGKTVEINRYLGSKQKLPLSLLNAFCTEFGIDRNLFIQDDIVDDVSPRKSNRPPPKPAAVAAMALIGATLGR
jgi:hypothetical protein